MMNRIVIKAEAERETEAKREAETEREAEAEPEAESYSLEIKSIAGPR